MSILSERVLWNRRYSDPSFMPDWAPDLVLAHRVPELPRGRAFDVASGVGANSLFLAKRGYKVDAIDISDVAVESLRRAAESEGVGANVNLILGDVRWHQLEPEAYELVVCLRYFSRELAPRLIASLKPGGALLCRALTSAAIGRNARHANPDRLIAPGELVNLLSALEAHCYEESETPGDSNALYVGRKPER